MLGRRVRSRGSGVCLHLGTRGWHALTQSLSTSLASCSSCFYLSLPAQAGPKTSTNFTMKTKGFWSCWSFLVPLVPPCSQGRKLP